MSALTDAQATVAEIEATSYWATCKTRPTTHLYKAHALAQKVVAALTPAPDPAPAPTTAPAPVPAGPVFGHCKNIERGDLAYCQREYAEMVASGGKCPRIDYWQGGTQAVTIPAARAAGFPHLLLCIGDTLRAVPDPATYAALCVQAAKENPTAYIEFANESGINGWTPADCVRVWNAAYKALRDAGCANKVLMGSIAGDERRSYGRLGSQQWCRELVAAGFKIGVSADWANFHDYGDVTVQEPWMSYWTPYNGASCLTILGATEFGMTEFNVPLGDVAGDEQRAADGLVAWVAALRAQPGCRVATVYALSDDAGGVTSGYGLCGPSATGWVRRKSFDAYRAATA